MRTLFIVLSLCIASVAYCQPKEAPRVDVKPPAGNATDSKPQSEPAPETFSKALAEAKEKNNRGTQDTFESVIGIKFSEALMLIVTILIWIANRDLVSGAADTAERELRAYVAFNSLEWVATPGEGQHLKARVQNYGKTPAHSMTIWTWSTDEEPRRGTYVYPGGEPVSRPQMLHPTQPFNTRASLHLSYTFVSNAYFVYGRIVYRDIYRDWWVTRFCYLCEGENRFVPWGEHNCEDGPYKTESEALA